MASERLCSRLEPADVFALIDELVDARAWRDLELSFAHALQGFDPSADALVLLGGVLAAWAETGGNVCVDLSAYDPRTDHPDSEELMEGSDTGDALSPRDEAWVHHRVRRLLRRRQVTIDAWRAALAASALVEDRSASVEAAHGPAETARLHVVSSVFGHVSRTPLVRMDDLLYLRRSYRYERGVAEALCALRVPGTTDANTQAVGGTSISSDAADLRPLLDALFARPGSEGQRRACERALHERFIVITGGPGTGKTSTVARLLVLLAARHGREGERPLRIVLAAPTGKAAARVTEALQRERDGLLAIAQAQDCTAAFDVWPEQTLTLHRLLRADMRTGRFRRDRYDPIPADVVVVDEASMIDVRMMWALLEALPQHARLVLLGDRDQLASVEAGSVMAALCELGDVAEGDATGSVLAAAVPVAVLEHSHRFPAGSPLGRLAAAVNRGQAAEAHAIVRQDESGALAWCALSQGAPGDALPAPFEALVVEGCRRWLDAVDRLEDAARDAKARSLPAEAWGAVQEQRAAEVLEAMRGFQVLCAQRGGEWGVERLNQRCAAALRRARRLAPTSPWYVGRPVMVTRNDYASGLMNGDVGITLRHRASPDAPPTLRVAFRGPDSRIVFKSVARLPDVETVFCMTVHKAQGSEFEHVVLVLPETHGALLTRELVYTGLSRARITYAGDTYVSGRFTLVTTSHVEQAMSTDAATLHPVLARSIEARVQRVSGLRALLAQQAANEASRAPSPTTA